MILHLIELAVMLVVTMTIGRWWLRRQVVKRLCPACEGTGRTPLMYRGVPSHRPCHACNMKGTTNNV